MSALLRVKKRIVSKFSETGAGKKAIINLLGVEGGKALDALMCIIEDFDGPDFRKQMEGTILKLVAKAGMIYSGKRLDSRKTQLRMEKPVARLCELLIQSTSEVASEGALQIVDSASASGGKRGSKRRSSLSAREARDVAYRRQMRRPSTAVFEPDSIPERDLLNKLTDSIRTVCTLLNALLTGHMTEKNRSKIDMLSKAFRRQQFLTYVLNSPGCTEHRATLHQAFEFWSALARFKPSEEALAEREELYRMRYEALKDTLAINDFLDNPQYQKFLQLYIVFSGSLSDSIPFYNAVVGYREISSTRMCMSRAPGILHKFLKGKDTGVTEEETERIAKLIDDGKVNKRTFNQAQEQVLGRLKALYPDFLKSDAHEQFLEEVFKIARKGKK